MTAECITATVQIQVHPLTNIFYIQDLHLVLNVDILNQSILLTNISYIQGLHLVLNVDILNQSILLTNISYIQGFHLVLNSTTEHHRAPQIPQSTTNTTEHHKYHRAPQIPQSTTEHYRAPQIPQSTTEHQTAPCARLLSTDTSLQKLRGIDSA
ncbi:hypothetical protein RRG08_054994 [Elysia crispata]|uniref:Uncharacterized protein n=1 Tax=Elysia crispata TaxID=231223 RepID=A0AAE0XT44_9GAST|nr:hypothetical protein RRG08_054994 [Elysia crispata]